MQQIYLLPAKYRQSARISVIVHQFRQYGIEHLLLGTAQEFRYSAAQSAQSVAKTRRSSERTPDSLALWRYQAFITN